MSQTLLRGDSMGELARPARGVPPLLRGDSLGPGTVTASLSHTPPRGGMHTPARAVHALARLRTGARSAASSNHRGPGSAASARAGAGGFGSSPLAAHRSGGPGGPGSGGSGTAARLAVSVVWRGFSPEEDAAAGRPSGRAPSGAAAAAGIATTPSPAAARLSVTAAGIGSPATADATAGIGPGSPPEVVLGPRVARVLVGEYVVVLREGGPGQACLITEVTVAGAPRRDLTGDHRDMYDENFELIRAPVGLPTGMMGPGDALVGIGGRSLQRGSALAELSIAPPGCDLIFCKHGDVAGSLEVRCSCSMHLGTLTALRLALLL